MKLYYVPRTRATRPRWLLEELGVPYELVRLDQTKGETRTPEHLARHPLGHVPVLEDGEVRIFESAAICLWLAERFREKGLLPPAGSAAHARVLQWIFYAETELEPPLGTISRILRRPEAERDPHRIADAKERFLAAARPLEPVLAASVHVAGPDFTVADVIVGSVLSWGKAAAGGLAGLPAVDAYVLRMKARPALRRAVAD